MDAAGIQFMGVDAVRTKSGLPGTSCAKQGTVPSRVWRSEYQAYKARMRARGVVRMWVRSTHHTSQARPRTIRTWRQRVQGAAPAEYPWVARTRNGLVSAVGGLADATEAADLERGQVQSPRGWFTHRCCTRFGSRFVCNLDLYPCGSGLLRRVYYTSADARCSPRQKTRGYTDW